MILSAIYTDPYDQSLWFYYEWLMTNNILPADKEDRLTTQVQLMMDMLPEIDDSKWLYEALVRYNIMLRDLQGQQAIPSNERALVELRSWLAELKKLDPLRDGRWKDIETLMNHS